jgi:hypothetical protein
VCEKVFIDKRGRNIVLKLDFELLEVKAFHADRLIGNISWGTNVYKDGYQFKEQVYLTNIFLDKFDGYVNNGIGTAAVKMIIDYFGIHKIKLISDTGFQRDDGAHPTGNALQFYESLFKKGLGYW